MSMLWSQLWTRFHFQWHDPPPLPAPDLLRIVPIRTFAEDQRGEHEEVRATESGTEAEGADVLGAAV